MLACLRDSKMRSLQTELLSCTPSSQGGFCLELADTILYPEGGGQPSDHGQIEGVAIRNVQKNASGGVQHWVDRKIALGPVQVTLDWGRRLDHMQQHSGQHLLTAITQERLGLATSSFHLGETQSHIDLDGPPMEAAALRELEEAANGKISDAVPIRPRIVLPEDLEALGVRSSGLPLGHHGDVRLIEIEGLDLNTCGGTHVSNTAELGVIQLLSCARIKTGSRLHFLVGGRVRQALRTARAHEQKLNRLLQGGPETHLTRIEKLLSGEKSAARALKNLRLELATAQAIALAQASGPLVHHHQPGGDMNHLRSLASAALRADDPRVLLLTASDASGQGIFLLAGEAEGVARLGPAAAEAMGGRGGGAGGRYQGKAKHTDISSDLIRQLETLLRS